MNRRPLSVTVISCLFIAFGVIALVAGALPAVDGAGRFIELGTERRIELGLIWLARILAIVGGAFMLRGFNWARWLLVAWMGFHVVLSFFHPPLELLVHGLLFSLILFFLFRPGSSAYFRGAGTQPPPVS